LAVNKLKHIREVAREKGVICEKPVWKPLHRFYPSGECPNSDHVWNRALSVPLYPSLTEEETEYVAKTLSAILKETNPSTCALDDQKNA
jgi:dTDP-4-amino-4,6-dideoxygalactose transaminase